MLFHALDWVGGPSKTLRPAAANRYSKHARTEPKNMNLGWLVGSAAYHLENLLQVHSGDYFGVGLIVAGHVHTRAAVDFQQSRIRTFWRKFVKFANMNDFAVMRLRSASCTQRSLPSPSMVRDDPEHMFNLAFKLRKTPQIDETWIRLDPLFVFVSASISAANLLPEPTAAASFFFTWVHL